MMTVVSTEPSGCVQRKPDGEGHRKVAILYGRPRFRSRASEGRRGGKWELTPAEQWALDNKWCIGVTLKDDTRELGLWPHQRRQLVQLGALAMGEVPGGVLVEDLEDLGTPLARVVACRALRQVGLDVRAPAKDLSRHKSTTTPTEISESKVKEWEELVQHGELTEADDAYRNAVQQRYLELLQQRVPDPFVHLGSGPRRDVDMARDVDAALRAEGWSDRRIRDYLSLYGFANPSGKVGVWNHSNHKTLRSRR